MNVCIVGTGYVGLVSGVCLAEWGHRVVCVDTDESKVARINSGQAPIHEDGLPELLARHAGRGLRATTDLAQAVADAEVTFIAVGTPALDGRIDLTHVARAADEIGAALRGRSDYHVVVVKSTVVPGTTAGVVRERLEAASGRRAGTGFGLGMNPEFLTEGSAVQDFLHPDRLVLGGIDARSHDVLRRLYEGVDPSVPRLMTNPSTAEMIKYASNAVLATLISFSNEIARLCSAVGDIDALEVMRGVHEAAYFAGRRGTAPITAFLEAGCGFGGSCLPKDVTALLGQAGGLGVAMPLLASVLAVNRGQPDEMMRLAGRHHARLDKLPVTVLGLAFKPGTDDTRESPAFPLISRLRDAGACITAYDPVARPDAGGAALEGVTLADTMESAVQNADIVFLTTRWPEFRELPRVLREMNRAPLVVDGRRLLDPAEVACYEGIGR